MPQRRPDSLVAVAVFSPARQLFHYYPPPGADNVPPGARVVIPFGRTTRIGLSMGSVSQTDAAGGSYKAIERVLDQTPLLDAGELELAQWAGRYYHHPLGDVCATMMPAMYRKGKSYSAPLQIEWSLAVNPELIDLPKRAIRQQHIVELLVERPRTGHEFDQCGFDWRKPMAALCDRGWVNKREITECPELAAVADDGSAAVVLNEEQTEAVDRITSSLGSYQTYLLDGVTGSGKTDVYMAVISKLLADGKQALVLLPEIALTQHLVQRFKRRFGDCVGVMHSGLTDLERARVWHDCRASRVLILLGTRSAVWTRMPELGGIFVDEEHDPSFKQQEGFRYNARDVAVIRASKLGIPIVLGTATPSFESFRNADTGKYQRLKLASRAGGAQLPRVQCIDIRGVALTGGLSDQMLRAVEQRLRNKEQSLLFLNRRGYAPVVLCHACGAIAQCDRCDAKLVYHHQRGVLVCHQCEKTVRPDRYPACCDSPEWIHLGQGTEQLEEIIKTQFPTARVERIDRDKVRKKAELDRIFSEVKSGAVDILLGTQMLAKGHDFSRVTLVGIVDADSRLFSLDFRAEERLAQLLVQVSGRAGRAELSGEVLIQTHQPNHWLLRTLMAGGYGDFIEKGLAERQQIGLPPFTNIALLRAEAVKLDTTLTFLRKIHTFMGTLPSRAVEVTAPIPSAVERRAGKYRAEIMFTASRRDALAMQLSQVVEYASQLPEKSRVRWALDIDPQEM